MQRRIILMLSIAVMATAITWMAIQPSPEPLLAVLAATIGIVSQARLRPDSAHARTESEELSQTNEPRILVIPFTNLSPDPENEYFSDGLTEELIAALARVRALRVISRHSAMSLKQTNRSLKELASELSVDFVVEGAVRKDGDSIRITIHVVNAQADSEVWSESFDGTPNSAFTFQAAVATKIVHALNLRLDDSDRQIGSRAPADSRAFEAYLRGRHELGNWSRESSERAHRYFSEGLAILGENALLHVGLGYADFRLAHIVPGAMDKHMHLAAQSAARALSLDSELATAHVLSGLVDWKSGKIGSALRHFRKALRTDPNDADALTWSVFCFAEVGPSDFVQECAKRLVLVDPLNSFTRFTEGFAALMQCDATEALAAFERSLSLDPNSTNSIAFAAFADVHLGNRERAQHRLARLQPGPQADVWTHLGIGLLAALNGQRLEFPTQVIEDSRKDETFAWWIAECHALLGHRTEVLEWLDTALEWGFSNVEFLTSEFSGMAVVWKEAAFVTWIDRARARRDDVLLAAEAP